MDNTSNTGFRAWCRSLMAVWRREFTLVFGDAGIILFFFALPLMYPVVYTLIYNPELVRNVPIVVVDQCRTATSREFTRMVNANDNIEVYDYAPTVEDARRIMARHEAYGTLLILEDFGKQIGRGEQAHATLYCDMSLLLRYRGFVSAMSDIQLAYGEVIRTETLDRLGLPAQGMGKSPTLQEAVMLGDTSQGFASFVIPGIVVLILQQSMVLGICMLGGTASERRRRNGGIDPRAVNAPPSASLLGRALCWIVCYIPMTLYVLHLVPMMFTLPHIGNIWEELAFIFPMLTATAMFGICLSVFVTERESSLVVVVFTSVIFLFLSGLLWPRYAMSPFWTMVGDCVPCVWGVEGFVRMNSNGASLGQQAHPYLMMWLLTAVYGILAYWLTRVRERPMRLAVN